MIILELYNRKKTFFVNYEYDLASCECYIPTRTYVKYSLQERSLAIWHIEIFTNVMKGPIQMINSDVYGCVQIHINEKLTADNMNDNHASGQHIVCNQEFACPLGKGIRLLEFTR